MKRVLVTGSTGRIGRAAAAELQRRGYSVRGFDLSATPDLDDMIVGTLTDRESVDRATANCDTVIHLAATPDDDDFHSQLLPNNIVGVYNILESAQAAGVKRLILASTGQVVWYERDRNSGVIRTDTQPTPKYWYAACKCFLEGAGRAFAEKFGMSVLAVRLGWCPRSREQVEEIASLDWCRTFISVRMMPVAFSPVRWSRRSRWSSPSSTPPASRSIGRATTWSRPSASSASNPRRPGRRVQKSS